MKKQKQITIFFFSLIFLAVFIDTINFVIAIDVNDQHNIEYWNNAEIENSNIKLSLGTQLPSNIKYDFYSSQIERVVPLGVSETADGTTKIFEARIETKFSLILWTETSVDRAVDATQVTGNAPWLTLITDSIWSRPPSHAVYQYKATYNKYNIRGSKVPGYNGRVKINAELADITPATLNFGQTNIQISNKKFVAVPGELFVLKSQQQNHASYCTTVETSGSTELRNLDTAKDLNAAIEQSGDPNGEVSAYFRKVNLGVHRGSRYESTLQQGVCSGPSAGADNLLEKGFNLNMREDIKLMKEPLTYTYQQLAVDTKSQIGSPAGIYSPSCGPVETRIISDRVIGWKVQNKAMQIDFQMNFVAYSEVLIADKSPEIAKPEPQIPDSQLEDMYWDSIIGGDTGVTTVINSDTALDELWKQNGTAVITIIIVVLVILGVVLAVYLFFQFGGAGKMAANAARKNARSFSSRGGHGYY